MDEAGSIEDVLGNFDAALRLAALRRLAPGAGGGMPVADPGRVGMHFHTFFSFNALEYSPSMVAWEARKAGLYAAAICDFDVLDGLEEFLLAGLLLGLRTAAHVETRSFLTAFPNEDITSPGEPGVTYIMGAGFPRVPADGTTQASGLQALRRAAGDRNRELVDRINRALPEAALDYETDVLSLTPAGNATERHIVRAYVNKVVDVFEHPDRAGLFWSKALGLPFEETLLLMADMPALEERVRSRLVKKGGYGYVQPDAGTFPPAGDFCKWVVSCGAIPMITWLDGTSGAERDADGLLDAMQGIGAAALNIIPDRNWNIRDGKQREVKQARLAEIVGLCRKRQMPVNIGTEMNKHGLPFVDDLSRAPLGEFRETFLSGARVMVGQTILARYANCDYCGGRAAAEFPSVADRNRFFEAVGALPPLDEAAALHLEQVGPERAFTDIRDRVAAAA